MNRRMIWLSMVFSATAPLGVAQAQINGLVNAPYVFFDRPDSTLVMNNSNSVNPGTASISDTIPPGATGSNRHDVVLSSDGGTSGHIFGIDDSFLFSTLVTLSDVSNSPRKEAGIRINSSITGDALFIVNSDAGEIVAFGGGAPFFIFGSNGGSNGYTPGTTILLGIREIGGGDGSGGVANTLEYFIDRLPFALGGEATSGPLAWSNLELGPLSYNVTMYAQGGAALNAADNFTAVFGDITYQAIPEPSTSVLGLLSLTGLSWIRRRAAR